ncbi:hypothetical protein HKX69_30050 [Streptomyces argyrophyllae]|uniref:Uncharacterized protein n=1 Tax=Streptomyces argyrophylli TaxID=2726118 RepID=A0A6M4PQM5_9ACTN|nr:hypothetical protein [Streptomyces argyrophyllae]QJS13222.1 hypothetical protein HKX69_30050 [Streptomyces argyrophyllae]
MRNTQQRGPASTPNPATPPATGHATQSSVAAGADGSAAMIAAIREKWASEHTRRTQAFLAIREHLQEQPSAQAVRTAARLWCRDITHLADDVVAAMNSTETTE